MASKQPPLMRPLELLLQRLLAQEYELEQMLGDFNAPNAQALLQERLIEFMAGVQELRDLAPKYGHIELPADLLRWVDEGGHPDEYVKKLFGEALRDNQIAKGRVTAIQQLRDELATLADEAFPQAMSAYKAALTEEEPKPS